MSTDVILSIVLESIALFFLIIFSSYFSAFEAAISATNKFQLETYYKKRKKGFVFQKINFFIDKYNMTISMILTGNNLVAVGASTIATLLFTQICMHSGVANAESVAAGLSTGIITALLLIFGEFLPKSFARHHNILFMRLFIFLNLFFYYLFWPISWFLNFLTFSKNKNQDITEQDLHSLVTVIKREGVLDSREASLVRNAISFDDTKIASIMTPSKWMQSVNIRANKQTIAKTFIDHKYSRLPVKDKNKFVGIITSKSFFYTMYQKDDKFKLSDIIEPVIYVSQHARLDTVLQQMQVSQCHLALVKKTNESSKIIGLVTMENLLEHLVGKIYDEHDENLQVAKINDFTFRVAGEQNAANFFNQYIKEYAITQNLDVNMLNWFKQEFKIKRMSNQLRRENDCLIVIATKNKKNQSYEFVIEKKAEKLS